MSFRGWPAEALEFYEGLEADNSRTYWTAHKELYDEAVYAPAVELLGELEDEFGAGKIFRPYRDVRFSADKSPYKTHLGALLEHGGYIQLSARGLACASGMHRMAPDQLERYRRAVAEDVTGRELERVIAQLAEPGLTVHGVDSLKSAPRGYPKDHPRIALLRHKGLVSWQEWPVEPWLGTAGAKQRITGFLHAAKPLQDWLDTRVGPSQS
jgi:uncharacterized protein (TIGR02453 family)